MSPKQYTNQEKEAQKEKLLNKGKELLSIYGVRKTSVEDITKAALMAKGTFYQYFESKEFFFFELIVQYHREWFQRAEAALTQLGGVPIRARLRGFIRHCFLSPEFLAVFKYHDELVELLQGIRRLAYNQVDDLLEMEHSAYEQLLALCRVDTQKVKPGVVHNYLHAIYFALANSSIMEKECMDDTFDLLLDGLMTYIFGGEEEAHTKNCNE